MSSTAWGPNVTPPMRPSGDVAACAHGPMMRRCPLRASSVGACFCISTKLRIDPPLKMSCQPPAWSAFTFIRP